MKKIITLIFAIALNISVLAQCPLANAVDFTATDCHGNEVHLFDILDGGQYVLIDFFFTTCGECNATVPMVVESYHALGCNRHDVFYMEISDSDSNAACQNWETNYGVEYPTIGFSGGGMTICNNYMIGAFPTVILIAPNRQIVLHDIYPIDDAQTVIDALESQGIQQHDCEDAFAENYADFFTLFPNPVKDKLMIEGKNLGNISVYNALGQVIFDTFCTDDLIINTADYPNGIYFVKIGNKVEKFVVNH